VVHLSFAGQAFVPLPSGALWWPAERTLLVADLHLEKASHFARRGWMLPPFDSVATLQALERDLAATGAAELVALGDSVHDATAWQRLPPGAWALLARLACQVAITWIAGNHDPQPPNGVGASTVAELARAGLILRHQPAAADLRPQIAGHFHPKIALKARGRRIVRRCFVAGPARLLLPAYGALAGGLDAQDPAIRAAAGEPAVAHVPLARGLLRVPLAA
jgi:DNA ligase-associated metallophosphoesterase